MEIHRHHYRGELWYVLQDHSSGRFQRFTPAAYMIIGLMDGKRTVQEIWDAVRARLADDAPTQEEVIRLLSQLHTADALQADVMPDTLELLKRFEKKQTGKLLQNLRSPLFVRIPVFDPERFLTKYQNVVRPFFSWAGALLWLVVVGSAIFLAGVHWPELTENITDRILAPGNLLVLWLVFPVLKIFHEFGHGFAVKIKGGEVHDMGIMLLVFTPIPYVDASSASAFQEKRSRLLVGAAGMLVEIFIAALALFVWINIEPGTIRAVAYNVMFIAGVSSLLFNGNPLLRYDAYYILSDLVEIPNLAPRGLRYLGYLMQRYLAGIKDADPPLSTRGERLWFFFYSIAAFIYRMIIFTAIILFIATKFFFIGILFACWAFVSMFILPALKGLKFLLTSPRLNRRRIRAIMGTGVVLTGFVALVTLVPVPLSTRAEGVMWISEQAFARAGTDGFIERFVAEPGSRVEPGDALIACFDPLLPAHIKVLESQLREIQATYDTQVFTERVKAEITKEEMNNIASKLADARERAAELMIRSPGGGTFVVPMSQDLPGRFVRRGELLGYVLDRSVLAVRVIVFQQDVDFVRQHTTDIQVRLPGRMDETLSAVMQREVPGATDQIPGRTLSQEGGGEIAIDPRSMLDIKAFQKVFLFDIKLPFYRGLYRVGERVYVRFGHGKEPIVWRWYRGLRQLFLKRFNV
ncbi:MAG: PqqD family peptide modification chaperone [Desulfobacterales bacterium]|nr:PqqD family peptide modification chaperone [Desulfobacterales bacterium]